MSTEASADQAVLAIGDLDQRKHSTTWFTHRITRCLSLGLPGRLNFFITFNTMESRTLNRACCLRVRPGRVVAINLQLAVTILMLLCCGAGTVGVESLLRFDF
jgi:hypothetical protein